MARRHQGIVEGADVDLGPAIIVGGDNVDGLGHREREQQRQSVEIHLQLQELGKLPIRLGEQRNLWQLK